MAVIQTANNQIGIGKAGPGRHKGIPNKQTTQLKEMILAALDASGGVDYLTKQAEENPGPFMALVGKVLPLQVAGAGDDGQHVVEVRYSVVRP